MLAILGVLLAPTAAASNDGLSVEGPQLTPGDSWTYRTNTSLESGLSLEGRVTLTVKARAPALIEGTTYDAYDMSVSGAGTAEGIVGTQFGSTAASGSWILTGRQLLEARGLKIVSRVLDLEANGTLQTQPGPLAFALRVQNTTSYRLQGDAWYFPLRIGDSAVVSSQMNYSEDFGLSIGLPTTPVHSAGLVWWNVTHALRDPIGIQTPAGEFETYPIRETYPDGSSTIFFYAPLAGNHARTETRNETTEVSRSEIVAYRYQALEPAGFLGLTPIAWAAIAAVSVGVVIASVVLLSRRRKRRGADAPEEAAPRPES